LGAGLGLLIGLIALGPALLRGYVLTYDMVFVPQQPITSTVLGTDGSVPRAVPNDLLVALLSTVVPADLVQKLVLLAVFALGGWGVARLLDGPLGATVAVTAYLWNAYVGWSSGTGVSCSVTPRCRGSSPQQSRRATGAAPHWHDWPSALRSSAWRGAPPSCSPYLPRSS
jgi:hypothetical protein